MYRDEEKQRKKALEQFKRFNTKRISDKNTQKTNLQTRLKRSEP